MSKMLCQSSELLNALLNMFRNRTLEAKSCKSKSRDRSHLLLGSLTPLCMIIVRAYYLASNLLSAPYSRFAVCLLFLLAFHLQLSIGITRDIPYVLMRESSQTASRNCCTAIVLTSLSELSFARFLEWAHLCRSPCGGAIKKREHRTTISLPILNK